jgi:hypothetical protein
MRISGSGKSKSISVTRYYNAFHLMDFNYNADSWIVKENDMINYEIESILPKHLIELIKSFNKKYEEVAPEMKVVISNQIARPGLIADYIKQLQNFICQICKEKGFIQSNNNYYIEAHHIIELHKIIPGSLCSDNIVIVCPTCHRKLHYANVKYIKYLDDRIYLEINGKEYCIVRNIISI